MPYGIYFDNPILEEQARRAPYFPQFIIDTGRPSYGFRENEEGNRTPIRTITLYCKVRRLNREGFWYSIFVKETFEIDDDVWNRNREYQSFHITGRFLDQCYRVLLFHQYDPVYYEHDENQQSEAERLNLFIPRFDGDQASF